MSGKKQWIQKAIKNPGAFTRKAKRAGMGTQQFANRVLANPTRYSPQTRKQAQLAKTLKKVSKK